MLNTWRNPAVRDLYWAINSPSLISTAELTHWQDHTSFFMQHLNQLDKHPEPLFEWLAKGLPSHRSPRLGQYFECLWHYYFHHHPHYQLITHNLQIKSPEKITLGELDIVVRDRWRDCVMHIELAVKFYLGLNHLIRAEHPHVENIEAFIGPGLRDRLIDKYTHTFNHQLPLSSSPIVKTMGIHIDEVHAVFKGRLFHPSITSINHNHLWLSEQQFSKQQKDLCYLILDKSQWFSERRLSENMPLPLAHSFLDLAALTHPKQIAVFNPHSGDEDRRLFIVPDTWELKAYHEYIKKPF